MNCIETISQSIDSGNFACSVFVDLQKAFDMVDHRILLKKLGHYGIRGSPLAWLKSFLTNRSQFVSIANVHSHTNMEFLKAQFWVHYFYLY